MSLEQRAILEERLLKEDKIEIKDGFIVLKGDYYKEQIRIALKNCGIIDPGNIEEYIALDGYKSLARALIEETPIKIIEQISESNLRGRGGAGFPTGRKWNEAYKTLSDQKYFICNADEGDPGAFMDRSILENDPHSVLEGMAIGGYAIGSNQGYIYVRAEYPMAVKKLRIAIKQAKEYGLLGDNILGTGFNFDIELRLGSGAFVCGEGTALIESIEGKRGMPRNKKARTSHKGLYQQPTILNNVETIACVPVILQRGTEWFKNIGTEKSTGTKVFALVGKVEKAGLVEVPMGMPLRNIINDIGGGVQDGKALKAVQTGGPSGGCIPVSLMDTPVDFESLDKIGSIIGSGGMVVMDENTCMVDIARFFLEFTVDESCGKCTPCRVGNKRMLEILTMITNGTAELHHIEDLKEIAEVIAETSLCGLGQTAPNPVLSTLNYFYDEYLTHVKDKKCPAGVCQALITYSIDEKCIGCTKCVKVCPTSCISGNKKEQHEIDQNLCVVCGACFEICPVSAIRKG
ncbi:4Fe-4S dicluster domain-containing protein [Alkalibaculum sp. M08DMB]|uniref:4Fe-4S dicluster domain-containing protein n=2 Tax=Alkalibaculum sporogenes TaxID=2655001 RepID=A0A6A7K5B8_9FIRM|nr:4Fe-4S dicluster domain-containing protein [Alkalibaculum sporogenes]